MPMIPRLLACTALVACVSLPAAAQKLAPADRAEAYAAAVRHWRGDERRSLVLDPAGLADDDRPGTESADLPPPEIVQRLLATGLFAGVCRVEPLGRRSLCPDSVPGMRVRFFSPERASRDTLQFVAAFSSIPSGSTRVFRVSHWFRVVRVDGAWRVVETRRRSIT